MTRLARTVSRETPALEAVKLEVERARREKRKTRP